MHCLLSFQSARIAYVFGDGVVENAERGMSTTKRQHRVLMISAAFPPAGGAGVQRSSKFAKYLGRFGWEPIVWTVGSYAGLPHDPTLEADLPPGLRVVRHPGGTGSNGHRLSRLREFVRKATGGGRVGDAIQWRLRNLQSRRALPDEFAPWAGRSLRPALRLIEQTGADALYSTFSPASNHLLALRLKRQVDLPWIADFRDLWTEDYRYRETSPRRRRVHERLQREILEQADVVVGVTRTQTEILANHVPDRREKFVTIPNGFDPAEWDRHDGTDARHLHMTLAHVGRLDRWVFHEAFLSGLSRFFYSLGPKRERFRLRLVGHVGRDVHERLERAGICFEYGGFVTHEVALHEMRSADALLVCVPDGVNGGTTVPGKLYECLASGRPVVVVGPEGCECGSIVRSCNGGLVAPLDSGAVHGAFTRLFRAWSAGQPMPGANREMIERFSRIELAGKLASVLDGLIAPVEGLNALPVSRNDKTVRAVEAGVLV